MKRFVSLFVQALNGYLLVASLLVSCTHIQLPHGVYPEDEPAAPPTRGTALPETATPPAKGVPDSSEHHLSADSSQVQYGTASWYGRPFHGRRTASGERYDMYEVTAAHRTAPLGTYALVTNLKNGQAIQVRINDRGPAKRHRILDLSYGAAREIGMVATGLARVKVEFLTLQAMAPVPKLSRLPVLLASASPVQATLAAALHAPPDVMRPGGQQPTGEQPVQSQRLTAALAMATIDWPDNAGSPWSPGYVRVVSPYAHPVSNVLQHAEAQYTWATRAMARSPGMLCSHVTG